MSGPVDSDYQKSQAELTAWKRRAEEAEARLALVYGHWSLANLAAKDVEYKLKRYPFMREVVEASDRVIAEYTHGGEIVGLRERMVSCLKRLEDGLKKLWEMDRS